MTDISQKKPIQNTQLPPIVNKQLQNKTNRQSTDKQQQIGANILPQTHKRKSRKNHKKLRKHSPEYYQQKKIKKLNRIRERNWDCHFINQEIPDFLNKKKFKSKRALTRAIQDRKSLTANEQKVSHKTGTIPIKKQGSQAHQADKKNKTAKSFKIRVVNKKQQQLAQQQKSTHKTQQIRQLLPKKPTIKTQKVRPKRGSQIDQQLKQLKQQYKKKIQQTTRQNKVLYCHQQLLQQFLSLIYNKGIREMLDKQLANVVSKKSQINKIMQAIQKRQALLLKVCQAKLQQKTIQTTDIAQRTQQQKKFFQLIDDYRTSTLVSIQQILKWKQYWQETYSDVFNSSKTFDLVWKDENYLLTIMKSTNNLLSQYYKNKQKSNEQSDTIKQKDPFLISFYTLFNQDKNIVLKIRACQLLLLEEQFNSIKK